MFTWQIPLQLFTSPHDKRCPVEHVPNIHFPLLSLSTFACSHCCRVVGAELCARPTRNRPTRILPWPLMGRGEREGSIPIHDCPIIFAGHTLAQDRFVTVDAQQRVGVHSWFYDTTPILYLDSRLPVRDFACNGVCRLQSKAGARLHLPCNYIYSKHWFSTVLRCIPRLVILHYIIACCALHCCRDVCGCAGCRPFRR